MTGQQTDWIAVDWGTSNLRAWAMDGARVLAEAVSDDGMGKLARDGFEPALIRLIGGGAFPGWMLLLAPVLEASLWPVVSVLLLVPQRRAPDRDESRPL